jgi:hypothetical protein
LIAIPSFSQRTGEAPQNKTPFGQRLFFGGALGFSVGTFSSMVDVSPIVGYSVTNDLMVGIGLTYKYYRYRDYYAQIDENGTIVDLVDFKANMFGGSLWSRYFLTSTEIPVIENIFLHAEIEPLLFINKYTPDPDGSYIDIFNTRYILQDDQVSLTGIFLGGGLMQPIGGRSFMYLELVWNFNEELYSPYSNPRIRIGVAAGF